MHTHNYKELGGKPLVSNSHCKIKKNYILVLFFRPRVEHYDLHNINSEGVVVARESAQYTKVQSLVCMIYIYMYISLLIKLGGSCGCS